MKLRRILHRQIHRVQRIAGPASVVLLIVNLSLVAYPYIAWRGIHPYVGLSLFALAFVGIVVAAANAYTVWLRMNVVERRSQIEHNPTEVYAMTPYQVMERRTWALPMLRAQIRIHDALNLDSSELRSIEDRWNRWARLGYIPRSDYEPDLLEYYREPGVRV